MCWHKDGDGRRQRGLFDPVKPNTFQVPQVRCARPQCNEEHRKVSKIGEQIIVEKKLVRGVQKVNHERDAAAAAETFSWGACCSGGAVPVCRTSINISLSCSP